MNDFDKIIESKKAEIVTLRAEKTPANAEETVSKIKKLRSEIVLLVEKQGGGDVKPEVKVEKKPDVAKKAPFKRTLPQKPVIPFDAYFAVLCTDPKKKFQPHHKEAIKKFILKYGKLIDTRENFDRIMASY